MVKPPLGKNVQFIFRKGNSLSFRDVLLDVRSRGVYSLIIDTRPESLPMMLNAVSSGGPGLGPDDNNSASIIIKLSTNPPPPFPRECNRSRVSVSELPSQILQTQMNNYKYHYHFVTFDLEIYDLENFRYNFVNLTAFRMVDIENVAVQRILREMEKFQPRNQPILNKTNVIRVMRLKHDDLRRGIKKEMKERKKEREQR